MDKFEAYCSPKKNTTYERYLFNTCIQDGRTFDAFLVDLRNTAKTCKFGDITDSLIKDRIVCGLDDKTVRERLLRDNELTLDKAISIAKPVEVSKSHIKALEGKQVESAEVNKGGATFRPVPKLKNKGKNQRKWGDTAKKTAIDVGHHMENYVLHMDNAVIIVRV